jgi:hypothetical protein
LRAWGEHLHLRRRLPAALLLRAHPVAEHANKRATVRRARYLVPTQSGPLRSAPAQRRRNLGGLALGPAPGNVDERCGAVDLLPLLRRRRRAGNTGPGQPTPSRSQDLRPRGFPSCGPRLGVQPARPSRHIGVELVVATLMLSSREAGLSRSIEFLPCGGNAEVRPRRRSQRRAGGCGEAPELDQISAKAGIAQDLEKLREARMVG